MAEHSTDRLAQLRRALTKECLERIRVLAHTPELSADEALGQVLCRWQYELWEQEAVLDYCAQHFKVSREDLGIAARKMDHIKQRDAPGPVTALYQATAPGVSTPLAGAIHRALALYWELNGRKFCPADMGHPKLEDPFAWDWGVIFGTRGLARAIHLEVLNPIFVNTVCPPGYVAHFRSRDLTLRVYREGGVDANVRGEAVARWKYEVAQRPERSEEFLEMLAIEESGMGWLSAHLELGAQAKARGGPQDRRPGATEFPAVRILEEASRAGAQDLWQLVALLRLGAEPWWMWRVDKSRR